MVEDEKPETAGIEDLKKELASIKNEMMWNELEDIKKEKMREELEAIKAEQAEKQQRYYVPYTPRLSILTVIMAMATLLAAGYLIGTLYQFGLTDEVSRYLAAYSIPISASILLTVASVVLFFIGLGLVTMAKK
ncbi:MAG TPA: hypothetical protein VMC84_03875 [Methanocella sp.]|uniref:hypothetical protein n=1 Tax=Methanocella sp. TaxID=2052833 RepID=UPI002D0031F1|nr:hypothetical protein [Methanocella sp.]HTY90292.1 hypothetical protein [Methanocella sp.]